jgi:flagellar basal-body rod protein FlgG
MTASLDAALSGMLEHQRNMELIANNLANVNTTAYKRVGVHFQDLLNTAELLAATRGELPAGETVETSAGVQSTGTSRSFAQGSLTPTGRTLDLAISGDGFFRVLMDDGSVAYTRDGTFSQGVDGRITTADGYTLEPAITLPSVYTDLKLDADGTIRVKRPLTESEVAALEPGDARDGIRETVGQVTLVRFPNASGLTSIGSNLFVESVESQAPIEGQPGVEGMGTVVSGWVEGSNVDIAEEMTNLTFANRAYQLNLTAYRTIEEMLRQAGQIA